MRAALQHRASLPLPELHGVMLADAFVARLRLWLRDTEAQLQEHEQLHVSAIVAGREVVVDFIGYHNPDLVALQGIDPTTGRRATLLAHQKAVQLLCAVEAVETGVPRRRIGFQADR